MQTTVLTAEEIEAKLAEITLKAGSHGDREAGMCVMEAVAWLAGEEHTDRPRCTDPAIAAFLRGWNDNLKSDAERDRWIKPLIPRLIGSRTDDLEVKRRRAYIAA